MLDSVVLGGIFDDFSMLLPFLDRHSVSEEE
jgi:hypothetical protein